MKDFDQTPCLPTCGAAWPASERSRSGCTRRWRRIDWKATSTPTREKKPWPPESSRCCATTTGSHRPIATTGMPSPAGVPLSAIAGELCGKATGVCGGKGGSMHVADQDLGMIGAMGIVAGGLPIATGAAFAARYRGEDRVAVAFFGDGAVHQGTFHEAMMFASLFTCPVLFVCENNLYAETTAVDYHLVAGSVTAMAEPYRVEAHEVDGMDVFAVRAAAAEAIDRARRTGRPQLLEAMTYRYYGQYEGRYPDLQTA